MLLASCKKDDVSFTYSPEEPRAGETVVFTNNTSEGEEWSWTFGDGTTSTSKSPRKIYKQPGEYHVILKADNKASRTYSATIHVHDTIPSIAVSDSIVHYFTPVTMTAEVYNPFSHKQSFTWLLPADITIVEGDTASQSLKVYFRKHSIDMPVHCTITQGTKVWETDTTLHVEDSPAPTIIMAAEGKLFKQRIYNVGYEEPVSTTLAESYSSHPTSISVSGDNVYIFNSDTTAAGVIARYNITSGSSSVVIQNGAEADKRGFERGFTRDNNIYWTSLDGIYSCPSTASDIPFSTENGTSIKRLAAATDITGLSSGGHAGGIALYNNVWLYAYNQGLHRFSLSTSGDISTRGTILADYTITQFAVEPVSGKIYFLADGLYVCNTDGSSIVKIDDNATGTALCADGGTNILLWSTAEGVFCRPLVKTGNNHDSHKPQQLNSLTPVLSIAVDNTER